MEFIRDLASERVGAAPDRSVLARIGDFMQYEGRHLDYLGDCVRGGKRRLGQLLKEWTEIYRL